MPLTMSCICCNIALRSSTFVEAQEQGLERARQPRADRRCGPLAPRACEHVASKARQSSPRQRASDKAGNQCFYLDAIFHNGKPRSLGTAVCWCRRGRCVALINCRRQGSRPARLARAARQWLYPRGTCNARSTLHRPASGDNARHLAMAPGHHASRTFSACPSDRRRRGRAPFPE